MHYYVHFTGTNRTTTTHVVCQFIYVFDMKVQ